MKHPFVLLTELRRNGARRIFQLAARAFVTIVFLGAQHSIWLQAATCHVNTVPELPAQVKNDRFELEKSAALFEEELKTKPSDPELRAGQIRNLADMDRLEEADRLASAFSAEAPVSSVAMVAKAYVLYKQGHLAESYAINAASQRLDPCQARVYLYLADYERSIANWQDAWNHIQLAHKLDPLSDDIAHDWIGFLPRNASLEARKAYAQTSNAFTETERKTLTEQVDKALAKPPVPRGCRPQNTGTSVHVKLSEQVIVPGEVNLTVPLTINGKTKHLILDTGASGISLTAVAASNLGLKTEGRGLVGGFGDDKPSSARVTHLSSVRMGDMEWTNCEAIVFSGRQGMADGLIGGDVFHEFLLTLDYPNQQLQLDVLPKRPDHSPTASNVLYSDAGDVEDDGTIHYRNRYIDPSMTAWSPFYRVETKLLLPTQINTASPVLFMVDTGADLTLVTTAAVRPLTKLHESNDSLYGLSGTVKTAYRTGPLTLHFGSLYQPMSSIVAIDKIPGTFSTKISGVLGTPTWRQITLHLDYRDNLMKADYRPIK